MPYEVDWPLWKEWLPAWGPVITGSATLVVGIFVAVIAWRQWRTAQDKLALDLFDRRFATFNAVLAASRKWAEEIPTAQRTTVFQARMPVVGEPSETGAEAFFRLSESARFLFGDEPWRALNILSGCLTAEEKAHAGVRMGPEEGDFDRTYAVYTAASHATQQARTSYRRACAPYMLMGHIAVNQPAKTFRWPWDRYVIAWPWPKTTEAKTTRR